MSHTNAILQNIPVASTATDAFEIAVLRIHGKERPTVTWKNRFFHCQWNVDILINKSRHLKKNWNVDHFDKIKKKRIIWFSGLEQSKIIFKNVDILSGHRARLPGGHLVRIPHGAVKRPWSSKRPYFILTKGISISKDSRNTSILCSLGIYMFILLFTLKFIQ